MIQRDVKINTSSTSTSQASGKECGSQVLSTKFQRGVSRKTNRSVKSDAEHLMGLWCFVFFNSTNTGQALKSKENFAAGQGKPYQRGSQPF
jgi:hypothetical protein